MVPIPMAMNLELRKRAFEVLNFLADSLRHYESRAQNIAMGYLIWERCFFFAISQTSSSLNCVHWGMVLDLSLSCTSVYLLLFLETVTMLYRIQNQLNRICKEQIDICPGILEARNEDDGDSSMEAGDSKDGFGLNFSFQVRALNYDSFRIVERKVFIWAIVCALLAVTAFELYACKHLLCS